MIGHWDILSTTHLNLIITNIYDQNGNWHVSKLIKLETTLYEVDWLSFQDILTGTYIT